MSSTSYKVLPRNYCALSPGLLETHNQKNYFRKCNSLDRMVDAMSINV